MFNQFLIRKLLNENSHLKEQIQVFQFTLSSFTYFDLTKIFTGENGEQQRFDEAIVY